MKNTSIFSTAALLCLLPVCGVLQAAAPASREIVLHDGGGNLLQGVAAYACYYDSDRVPAHAIDGSGLTPDGNGGYTCSTNAAGTMWMGAGKDTVHSKWFVVNFGKEVWLDSFDLWNFNMNIGKDYTNRGLKTIAVYTSLKESVVIPNVQTESQGSPTDISWDNGDWTLNKDGTAIGERKKAPGVYTYSSPDHIALNPVKARWFAIKIGAVFSTKNGGTGGYGGISELQFFFDEYATFDAGSVENVTQDSATVKSTLLLKEGVTTGEVHLVYGTADGGSNTNAWQNNVLVGDSCATGEVSKAIAGLTRNTKYFYAFYCVDRQHGDEPAWSVTGEFTTIGDLAAVMGSVESVTAHGADISGTLYTQDETTEVFVAYGAMNGGSNPENWDHHDSLGAKSAGAFTAQLAGLPADTAQTAAFYVMDGDTPVWSEPCVFKTLKNYAVESFTVSSATTSSATFSASVASADATAATVFIAYGTEVGGNSKESWQHFAEYSVPAESAGILTLQQLAQDTVYYAALFTSEGVKSDEVRFSTGAVSVTMPAAFYETDPTVQRVVFARPAVCSAEEWTIRYDVSGSAAEDYVQQLPGTLTFAEGESEVVVNLTPVINASSAATVLSLRLIEGDYAIADANARTMTVMDGSGLVGTDVYWNGEAEDVKWQTPGNWSVARTPIYLDTVTIAEACSASEPVDVADANATVAKLTLGPESGTLGALRVQNGIELKSTGGAVIGGETSDGTGLISIAEGAVFAVGGSELVFGSAEGSVGSGEIAGAVRVLSGKNIVVGASGMGALSLTGAGRVDIEESGQSGTLFLGRYETGRGTLTLTGNAYVDSGYTTRIGEAGYGELILADNATFNNSRSGAIIIGNTATGYGKVTMTGGKISGGGGIGTIGASGRGELYVKGGEFNTRGIRIGWNNGGYGYVEVDAGAKLSSGTTGYHLEIGGSGTGILKMRGGTAVYSKSGSIKVRTNAAGVGLLTGWGTVQCSSTNGELYNSGIVRADGEGDETRSLSISHRHSYIYNTFENDSTNGWYAVNKGRLSIGAQNVSLAAKEGITFFNWGENADDEVIDLVNSARFAFSNITAAVALNTGRIYAPDRSDVPALPGGREAVGVWKFETTGAYDSADVEFRYDHVKAPYGVQMYQWDAENETWTKLETTKLDGRRAKVTVSDASKMFAAVASGNGLILMIR